MENIHTAGPWEYRCKPFAPPETIGRRAPNGSLDLIANLAGSVPQAGEREANARIIAAAPDLLEALEKLSSLKIKGHSLIDRLQFSDSGRALSDIVLSAIAKAKATP